MIWISNNGSLTSFTIELPRLTNLPVVLYRVGRCLVLAQVDPQQGVHPRIPSPGTQPLSHRLANPGPWESNLIRQNFPAMVLPQNSVNEDLFISDPAPLSPFVQQVRFRCYKVTYKNFSVF